MVTACKATSQMRRNESHKTNRAYEGYRKRTQQARDEHADNKHDAHGYTQTLCGIDAVGKRVVVPGVAIEVGKSRQQSRRQRSDLCPSGSTQITEGPVDNRSDLDVIGKVLNDCRSSGKHGA